MRDEELRDAYVARLGQQAVDRARGECASPEAMLAVVEDRASEDERIDVIDHVMACPACRPEFEALRAIARAGEQLGAAGGGAADAPAVAAPAAAARARGWRVPRGLLAAAAAVVVMVGTSVVLRQRAAGDPGTSPVPAAPGAEPMRGAGDAVVDAVAPAGAVAREGLALVWRPVAGAAGYAVELLDAAGRPLYAAELRSPTDTALALPDSVRLTPGADYQWWVRARLPDGGERKSEMKSFTVGR